jgi:uracil-DNA glycosylase family 4
MTLQLDARQRAMLEEMGIRLFWPEGPEAPVQAATPAAAAAPAARAAPAPTPPQRAPAAPIAPPRVRAPGEDPSGLDWDGLEQAVADWAAARRRPAVLGAGDRRPDWLCGGEPPVEEEEHQGAPFAGDPGRLLDNMLAAVGVSRQRGAYLTNVAKCRLPPDRAQEDEELAQGLAFLQRQAALLQPRVILAMGRSAAQALVPGGEPLGKLRGRVHAWQGIPVVVTYHPAYLLRNPADKARAWADLCLAQSLVRG